MLLDMDQKNCSLEHGFLADIIATQQDSFEDINAVLNVVFVMKEGVVKK